jgi:pimeloyl-ACP methyl ester carboxylesterase
LFAFVVGKCSPDHTAVLAFHGNADISRWLVPWAEAVSRETGACVVIPEYRGYDGLAGAPTYEGSARDARAALSYLRETLGVPASNTVYFGHSLGTAIAVELADVEPPRSLVLQAPFSSAKEMARRMVLPGLAMFWKVISRVHFDTAVRVASLDVPVWVAHGDKDFVIPIRMGREVFAAAKRKGELLVIRGADHNDVPERGGRDYWTWLDKAIGGARTTVTPAARAGTQSEP